MSSLIAGFCWIGPLGQDLGLKVSLVTCTKMVEYEVKNILKDIVHAAICCCFKITLFDK